MSFNLNRRSLLRLSAGAAAGLAIPPGTSMAAPASDATDAVREEAVSAFADLGYAELPPLPLITGDAFNGGLRYDETRADGPVSPWMCVQPAARVEDIDEMGRPGVLACFSMIGFGVSQPPHQGLLFEQLMDYLTERRGLDPARLVFVSTELFRPYLDRYEMARAGRFIERPLEEAKAAGDGSGYFKPEGHTLGPEYPTVGLYYPQSGLTSHAELTYPLEAHLEIGEASVWPLDSDPVRSEGGGLGLERLAMVAGETVPGFEESRLSLLERLQEEAARDGEALPAGHESFAALGLR